jgi:hypothetical protein
MLARTIVTMLAGVAWISSAVAGEPSERADLTGLAVAPAVRVTEATPRTITADEIRALIEDPAIRHAVGLSENAWDFSVPDGVPGFGPILVAAPRAAATTLSCAERDVGLMTAIEDHGAANDVAPDRLAAAAFGMLQARALCGSGREAEALALYDGTLRGLGRMHAAR